MKINTTLLITVGSAACLGTVSGAIIAPVAWKQSNAFGALRLASNLSNATGMNVAETILYNTDGSPSGEASNANNISWTTSAKTTGGGSAGITAEIAEERVWVVIDLGASYNLTTIRIWNLNWDPTDATDHTDRGINQFDVYVRNTAADTSDGTVGGTAINVSQVSDAANALSSASAFSLGTTDPWTLAISNQTLTEAPGNDTYTGQSFGLTGSTGRFIAIKADSYYLDTGGVGLGKIRIEGIPEPHAALLGGLGLLMLYRRRR